MAGIPLDPVAIAQIEEADENKRSFVLIEFRMQSPESNFKSDDESDARC